MFETAEADEGIGRDKVKMTVRVPQIKNICCIGAGYVGGPTCAVIAAQNPHIQVSVVDLSKNRIAEWRDGEGLPIFEPGLLDVVRTARDGADGREPNLHFSTDVTKGIRDADLIFIAVNTPTKSEGHGAGSAANLSYIEAATRHIAEACEPGMDKIIVVKSTVPCGTGESLRNILEVLGPRNAHFDILSNPEFLAEGTAIRDLLEPDRVLIGSMQDARSIAAAQALSNVFSAWVPRSRILTINLWTSELAKLAANCMLAQRISSINSLSAICEATGADVSELSRAVGLDSRIGSKFMRSSVGFGGSCFRKDVLSLVYIAETLHLDQVARYWRGVVDINDYQKQRFTQRVVQRLHNTLWGKKIAVLGFAYKKDTGDTRESPAIAVIRDLITEQVGQVAIFDPQVKAQQIMKDIERPGSISAEKVRATVAVCDDALSACRDASAVLVLTEWDLFQTDYLPSFETGLPHDGTWDCGNALVPSLNPSEGYSISECWHRTSPSIASEDSGISMTSSALTTSKEPASGVDRIDWVGIARALRRPKLVFDGRGVVDPEKLCGLGLQVECIGKPT